MDGRIQNLYTRSAAINRVRTVVVPNLGAMAGLSFRYANAKVSFGYRADFFFGAIDGGIDTRKSEILVSTAHLPQSASAWANENGWSVYRGPRDDPSSSSFVREDA